MLQRRYGRLTLLLNGATRELFSSTQSGVALGFTWGVRYAPAHVLRLGLEGGAFAFVPQLQPYAYGGATVRVGTDRLWAEVYLGYPVPSWGPLMSLDLGWTM